MKYSTKEVISFVKENDVKFIRLAFCDIFGNLKNIAIMPSELERAFEKGISFDASTFANFKNDKNCDLLLIPDASTLSVLPWRPKSGRVVRFFCDIKYPDGTIFAGDSRASLKATAERASRLGYSCNIGTECEFYLFELDENGEPTTKPYDRGGYLDVAPLDKCENIRREICLSLEEMGLYPESSRHEYGPGQNEIDFKHSEIVSAADNMIYFKTTVQAIAAQNGVYASFMPKPFKLHNGSALHINLSITKNGKSIFSYNPNEQTAEGQHFIAGVLNRINEITCLLNPTTNSYKRFGHGFAPKYINWSYENRSQLIRIPFSEPERSRIEVRSADPTCNPYIVFNLLLSAGLEGIENKIPLQPSALDLATLPKLPINLTEAVENGRNSNFLKGVLSDEIFDNVFENFDNMIEQYNLCENVEEFERNMFF